MKICLKIAISLFAFCNLLFTNQINAANASRKIIGYYPNWAIYRSPCFKPHDINPNVVTHINYAFAKVDAQGNVSLFDSWADIEYRSDWNKEKPYWGNFRELFDLKQQYPHLKTLISIGGWTLSDTFSVLAAQSDSRKRFAKNVVDFCKKYNFDGVDIDWEYPCFVEHQGRPEDKENFTLLLEELHHAVKTQSPALLLTIAAPAGAWHYKNIEVDKIHHYLDWINLMTYDLHGPWKDSDNLVTNHQAALYPTKESNETLNVYSAVSYYITKGTPSEKIVVGIPLYGRTFAGANATFDGLYSQYKAAGSGTTAEAGIRFFSDIKQNLLSTYQLFWDKQAHASYLYNSTNKEFITFDDEKAISCKCQFIKEMDLGGAMVWELGLDTHPNWDAMTLISRELK